jgi:hypothetical protein
MSSRNPVKLATVQRPHLLVRAIRLVTTCYIIGAGIGVSVGWRSVRCVGSMMWGLP